jgi:cyanophycin synthetase
VRVDSAVELELTRQKLSAKAIPAEGQRVFIQSNGNVAFDVTDQVHPEVARQVALAARVVGLEIAGVDLVAQDISKPFEEQGAAIVEVNAGPGLLMHLKPASGTPQPVGKAIADHLFPANVDFRIPLVGIAGSKGKTLVAEMVGHFLRLTNQYVGVSCGNQLYFGNRIIKKEKPSDWENARRTLLNRAVEAAVIENNHLSMLIEGLAYDRCQVGVVLNIDSSTRFPEYAIYDEDQLFSIVRTQIDVVLPNGAAVLNADDPLVAKMAELCDGEVIFFSSNENSPLIEDHLKQGGRAVLVRDQEIVLKTARRDEQVLRLPKNPKSTPDSMQWKSINLAAAIATAWALGIPFNIILAGTETFYSASASQTEA